MGSLRPNLRRLNPRQQEVLHLLSKGLHNSEIGLQLEVSERTVRGYMNQLFLIFDVSNRTELVGAWLTLLAEPEVRSS